MSTSTVISVNPAKATVGDLNPEATATMLRYNILPTYSQKNRKGSKINILLRIRKSPTPLKWLLLGFIRLQHKRRQNRHDSPINYKAYYNNLTY